MLTNWIIASCYYL